jgi:protein ImuB
LLAGIDAKRAAEIFETLNLWGVRTFIELADLPWAGVAERLGQEGLRLKQLAQGKTDRPLNLVRPPLGFEQSLELEHAINELEPLSFILSRLLNHLCANLSEYALATNELRMRLVTNREFEEVCGQRSEPSQMDTTDVAHVHERTITLPVPMRDPKTFLRLLLLDIESQPPQAPVIGISIRAEPVKPHARQKGLFIPLAPEPEKLEITLARLTKLVGPARVGSPELLDTHRPDAFRMNKFRLRHKNGRNVRQQVMGTSAAPPIIGFRIFRPAWRADVQTIRGQPKRIDARAAQVRVRGRIVCAAGPWRASGEWWRPDVWARDEWDVVVSGSPGEENEVLCRIYRDLTSDEWFLAGIYD